MHLEVLVSAVAQDLRTARPKVGQASNVLLRAQNGCLMEVDRGHARLPIHAFCGTSRPRNSVRDRVRLTDEQAVAFSADFERTRLMRGRENQTLARCKNRYDTGRRSHFALRKGGDDLKAITLDRVVSDTRELA